MRKNLIAAAALFTFAGVVHADIISVAPRDTAGLIEAIEYANKTPGDHVIELAGKSLYAIGGSTDGQKGLALPTIRNKIRILGNGSEIRRYSDEALLLVSIAPAGSLRLENLTLAEGSRGAIVNHGKAELVRVRLIDNTATSNVSAIITNHGELDVSDSDISFNTISVAQRDAGIVLNYGSLEVQRTRFDSNYVGRKSHSRAEVSAILNLGEAEIRDVVLNRNAAQDDEGEARLANLVNLGEGRLANANVDTAGQWPATGAK